MQNYTNASIKDVSSLLHGYFDFIERDGFTLPVRFSKETLAFIEKNHPDRYVASLCCAGMHLSFTTDAEEISFDYTVDSKSYVNNSGIDIYEDDVFTAHYDVDPENIENIHVSYKRKNTQRSKIVIFYPSGSTFYMYNITLGNAEPTPRRSKLALFYGDSITQSSYIHTPSLSWAEYVAEALDAEQLNRGIGSFIFSPGSLPETTDCNADYVFTEYGLNDFIQFESIDDALAAADEFVKKLTALYKKAKIYVIAPSFTRKNSDIEAINVNLFPYSDALVKICEKHSVKFIDGNKLLPDITEVFWEDQIHLNEAGSAIFAYNILKYMGK